MSRETYSTLKVSCDICGTEIKGSDVGDIGCASEQNPQVILSISQEVWYGGVKTFEDVCKDCNRELVSTINALIQTKLHFDYAFS